MIIDFDEVTMAGGIITFPDFPYAGLPLQDADLIETIPIFGTTAGVTPGVGGIIDDPE